MCAYSRPDLDVRVNLGCNPIPLLEAEEDLICTRLLEDVLNRIPALDLALARLIRIAVFRILRDGAIAPIPLHLRAVVLLVVVGAVLHIDHETDPQRREAHGRSEERRVG